MNDRIPAEGKAGRVLITPENGSAPFYATVTMADEPLDEGTPLNKATLLKDATAALLGGGADMVPDEALVALKGFIDSISPESLGAARIEVGSYVGTGSSNMESTQWTIPLTFGFKPMFFALEGYVPNEDSTYDCFVSAFVANTEQTTHNGFYIRGTDQGVTKLRISFDGNTALITTHRYFTASGVEYRYVVLGQKEDA